MSVQGVNCVMCGAALGQPAGIHARRDCEICGRTPYKLPGKDGLDVGEGESVVIPAGAIKMSLRRGESSGQLTYHGVSWFVRSLLGNSAAAAPGEILQSLQSTQENAERVLKNSALLSDLDLDSEEGMNAAIDRLKEDETTVEWFSFLKAALAEIAQDAIGEGDAALAAYAAQHSMLAHAAIVFERDLKPLVWRGYGDVGTDQIGEALRLWDEHRANDDEEFWQQALTARPFLLNQLLAAPVVVEKGKAYVGGKGISNTGGNLLDFLLRQPVLDNVVLLEIKTPATQLLRSSPYRDGVHGPSDALGGGVIQLATYRQSLLNDYYATV